MSKNYFLNLSAKEAYKAYVRAYESHSLKHIYDVQNLGQLNKIYCIALIKTLWLMVDTKFTERLRYLYKNNSFLSLWGGPGKFLILNLEFLKVGTDPVFLRLLTKASK